MLVSFFCVHERDIEPKNSKVMTTVQSFSEIWATNKHHDQHAVFDRGKSKQQLVELLRVELCEVTENRLDVLGPADFNTG